MKPWHNRYLYGMHEPMPRDVMPAGWIVHLVEEGDNPEPHPGIDLSQWRGYGNIIRLQYSWGGNGTIPLADKLDAYLARVRSCVERSPEAHIWIPGNEPNHPNEWKAGHKLTATWVAHVYDSVWSVVHATPGHEEDEVLFPPAAPWIDVVGLGWIDYFKQSVRACQREIDGFAFHTYSRDQRPNHIISDAKMKPPYQHLSSEFRTYQDWMNAIPEPMQGRPVYLTETNPGANGDPWQDANTGWVQAAYDEIVRWNERHYGQEIRCLCLYRWPHYDKWYIEGKSGVIEDFQRAQEHGYTWREEQPPDPPDPPGDGIDYDRIRQIVREEARAAVQDVIPRWGLVPMEVGE